MSPLFSFEVLMHSVCMRLVVLAALVGVSSPACRCGSSASPEATAESPEAPVTDPAPAAPPPVPEPTPLDPAAVSWDVRDLAELGLQVPVIQEVAIDASTMNDASYMRQSAPPLALAVWSGPGRTLANWRARYQGKSTAGLSPPADARVCGQPAVRQEVAIVAGRRQVPTAAATELDIEGVAGGAALTEPAPSPPQSPTLRFETIPARTLIVLAFERAGVPVIVSYSVETERRQAFASVEQAFFDGLACPSPPN